MRVSAIAVLFVALAVLLVSCGGSTPTSEESGQGGANRGDPGSGENFDRDNYGELVSDPDAHRGAQVDITGQLLGSPEEAGDETAFQMYADPENLEWSTLVRYGGSVRVSTDDYVRVRGTVAGAFEGENAFGAALVIPEVEADSVLVLDPVEAIDPARETLNEEATVTDPAGFSLTL